MSNAPVPPPGSYIAGKYRVERVLGSGGMAVVLEATHMVLGQRVALKLLRTDVVQAPGVVERFRQEAQIAAQLPGEHVVRVTDVGQAETGEPYIVMELLVGLDLEAEILTRGALPVDEAVDILLQSCEGVAEAHGVGLIHRDLKPGNLFLTRRRDGSPHVKVLDFGISKLTRGEAALSLTQTTANTFGTPLYMSPEQIQSAKHVDMSSDQHALGAILYTLLTACPPYNAPSVTALSVIIATQPPPSMREVRPDIPVRLEAAVFRSLAKKPGDRFRDLAEFAQAIAPFGGIGADAAVRRIASALTSSCAAPFDHRGSQPGSGGPPPAGMLPPVASDLGFGAPPGYDSGLIARPQVPGSAPRPVVDMAGSRIAQTSAALTTAVSGDRSGSGRKVPLALAIIVVTALSVAGVVGFLLMRFGPRRGAEASMSVESAAPVAVTMQPSASPVEAIEPVPSSAEAAPSVADPESASAAASAAASAVASAPASATASDSVPDSATAAAASASASAAASAPVPPPVAVRPLPSTGRTWPPRPAASPAKPTPKKPSDPAKVFGAKR